MSKLLPYSPTFLTILKMFNGLAVLSTFIVYEGRVKDTDPVTIVFVEVKTGKSDLVARQKRIKEAVDSGRVRFEIYQPDDLRRHRLI